MNFYYIIQSCYKYVVYTLFMYLCCIALLHTALAFDDASNSSVIAPDINSNSTTQTAPLRLRVLEGKIAAVSLSISKILYSSAADSADDEITSIGKSILNTIENDLGYSNLIRVINASFHVGEVHSFSDKPNFVDWKVIGSRALLIVEVGRASNMNVALKVRLWDVELKKDIFALKYRTSSKNWRQLAHKVSDEVYTRLTGEGPYINSRIAIVVESGPKQARSKRLAIMDSDGANLRYLTTENEYVIGPKISPDGSMIAYVSYEGMKTPHVNMLNINNGKLRRFVVKGRMSFSPSFSPDSLFLAIGLSDSKGSNIHLVNLKNGKIKQLTNSIGIDSSPYFSPDGKHIVFESDRSGVQQLYIMDVDGSNVRRISFGKGRYGAPSWSPRGDLIAFTRWGSGKFHIGVMRIDGSHEKMLVESFLSDGATWSPNGREIMFFQESRGRNGKASLHKVDITGHFRKQLPLPFAASDPSWGPVM